MSSCTRSHISCSPGPERRCLPDFGLGAGPDTTEREAAENTCVVSLPERDADEAAASLLGIYGKRRSDSRRWPRFSIRIGWKAGTLAAAHSRRYSGDVTERGLVELPGAGGESGQPSIREMR